MIRSRVIPGIPIGRGAEMTPIFKEPRLEAIDLMKERPISGLLLRGKSMQFPGQDRMPMELRQRINANRTV